MPVEIKRAAPRDREVAYAIMAEYYEAVGVPLRDGPRTILGRQPGSGWLLWWPRRKSNACTCLRLGVAREYPKDYWRRRRGSSKRAATSGFILIARDEMKSAACCNELPFSCPRSSDKDGNWHSQRKAFEHEGRPAAFASSLATRHATEMRHLSQTNLGRERRRKFAGQKERLLR